MELDEKGLLILSHFRSNARKNLTKISKQTGIPVSTIFDKLKMYESSIIKKHTALLDFQKLGYDIRVDFIVKINHKDRDKLIKVVDYFINNDNNEANIVKSIFEDYSSWNYTYKSLAKSLNDGWYQKPYSPSMFL